MEDPFGAVVLPITTARLTLRPMVPTDRQRYAAIFQDPGTCRYLYREPLADDEVETSLAERFHTVAREQGYGFELGIDLEGQLAGTISLFLRSVEHRRGEVGYTLHPSARGQGLAAEAVRAMCDVGFGQLELHRIEGRLDARNTASARVLTAAGFEREGHLRQNEWVKGEWTDEVIYGLLHETWAATRT